MDADGKIDPTFFTTCRLCTIKPGSYQILPASQEQIKELFDITISPFDGLPQLLCEECKGIITKLHAIKRNFQRKQQNLIEQTKAKKNRIDALKEEDRATVESSSDVCSKKENSQTPEIETKTPDFSKLDAVSLLDIAKTGSQVIRSKSIEHSSVNDSVSSSTPHKCADEREATRVHEDYNEEYYNHTYDSNYAVKMPDQNLAADDSPDIQKGIKLVIKKTKDTNPVSDVTEVVEHSSPKAANMKPTDDKFAEKKRPINRVVEVKNASSSNAIAVSKPILLDEDSCATNSDAISLSSDDVVATVVLNKKAKTTVKKWYKIYTCKFCSQSFSRLHQIMPHIVTHTRFLSLHSQLSLKHCFVPLVQIGPRRIKSGPKPKCVNREEAVCLDKNRKIKNIFNHYYVYDYLQESRSVYSADNSDLKYQSDKIDGVNSRHGSSESDQKSVKRKRKNRISSSSSEDSNKEIKNNVSINESINSTDVLKISQRKDSSSTLELPKNKRNSLVKNENIDSNNRKIDSNGNVSKSISVDKKICNNADNYDKRYRSDKSDSVNISDDSSDSNRKSLKRNRKNRISSSSSEDGDKEIKEISSIDDCNNDVDTLKIQPKKDSSSTFDLSKKRKISSVESEGIIGSNNCKIDSNINRNSAEKKNCYKNGKRNPDLIRSHKMKIMSIVRNTLDKNISEEKSSLKDKIQKNENVYIDYLDENGIDVDWVFSRTSRTNKLLIKKVNYKDIGENVDYELCSKNDLEFKDLSKDLHDTRNLGNVPNMSSESVTADISQASSMTVPKNLNYTLDKDNALDKDKPAHKTSLAVDKDRAVPKTSRAVDKDKVVLKTSHATACDDKDKAVAKMSHAVNKDKMGQKIPRAGDRDRVVAKTSHAVASIKSYTNTNKKDKKKSTPVPTQIMPTPSPTLPTLSQSLLTPSSIVSSINQNPTVPNAMINNKAINMSLKVASKKKKNKGTTKRNANKKANPIKNFDFTKRFKEALDKSIKASPPKKDAKCSTEVSTNCSGSDVEVYCVSDEETECCKDDSPSDVNMCVISSTISLANFAIDPLSSQVGNISSETAQSNVCTQNMGYSTDQSSNQSVSQMLSIINHSIASNAEHLLGNVSVADKTQSNECTINLDASQKNNDKHGEEPRSVLRNALANQTVLPKQIISTPIGDQKLLLSFDPSQVQSALHNTTYNSQSIISTSNIIKPNEFPVIRKADSVTKPSKTYSRNLQLQKVVPDVSVTYSKLIPNDSNSRSISNQGNSNISTNVNSIRSDINVNNDSLPSMPNLECSSSLNFTVTTSVGSNNTVSNVGNSAILYSNLSYINKKNTTLNSFGSTSVNSDLVASAIGTSSTATLNVNTVPRIKCKPTSLLLSESSNESLSGLQLQNNTSGIDLASPFQKIVKELASKGFVLSEDNNSEDFTALARYPVKKFVQKLTVTLYVCKITSKRFCIQVTDDRGRLAVEKEPFSHQIEIFKSLLMPSVLQVIHKNSKELSQAISDNTSNFMFCCNNFLKVYS